MRFDLHTRASVRGQLQGLAAQMSSWNAVASLTDDEAERIQQRIVPFTHTVSAEQLCIGGVDGSGDYPALAYADSFVYVSVAHGTLYDADPVAGLRERDPGFGPLIDFCWLANDNEQRRASLDAAFDRLAGRALRDVIEQSDYRVLKSVSAGRAQDIGALADALVRPQAADVGNVGIQLRSLCETGAALRLLTIEKPPRYVLIDTTLSLPFVTRHELSLFHEHLKRLCCVEARARGIGFFALSKSHGLPAIEQIERIAASAVGEAEGKVAEHWYLRLPTKACDGWELSLVKERNVPPPGVVTYLLRFHRNVPVMRLDMDEGYWQRFVKSDNEAETRANEVHIFGDLDYASHDQRSYGYPYPIKAGHDRASLTEAERVALRKMIIDAAAEAGLRRSLFRSASAATGHE